MKTFLSFVFSYLTAFAIGQTINIESANRDTPDLRIERNNSGNIDIYEGYRKVRAIEKNYSSGYNIYDYNSSGGRELVQSVEKGFSGDEYIIYTYVNGYKERSQTIRGYDTYMNALYGNQSDLQNDNPVHVYNVDGGYIDNLGKTVLPADVKPFDFSEVDKMLAAQDKVTTELEKLYARAQEIAATLTKGGISAAEKDRLIKELKIIGEKANKLPRY